MVYNAYDRLIMDMKTLEMPSSAPLSKNPWYMLLHLFILFCSFGIVNGEII